MPGGVNSLGPPQCLQSQSSLPVAHSYSLSLSDSASHPLSTLSFLALYTQTLHPFLHLFICLSVYFPVCLQTPCQTGLDRADKRLIRDCMVHYTVLLLSLLQIHANQILLFTWRSTNKRALKRMICTFNIMQLIHFSWFSLVSSSSLLDGLVF